MSDQKYNGWTNYETWNCKLWLDNDEGSSIYWSEQARDAIDQYPEDKQDAVDRLAKVLACAHDDAEQAQLSGFLGDILTMALRQVNWREIAEHMIDDAVEDDDYQEHAGDDEPTQDEIDREA